MSPASPSPTATGMVPTGSGSARSRSTSFMTRLGSEPPLGVDASYSCRIGDALDRHQVGTESQRHLMAISLFAHLVEGLLQDLLEADVDLVFLPEQRLQVLNPFEVRHGHATGVGEDVGDDGDPAALENAVRVGRGRPVGAFDDEPRLDPSRVARGDLILHRSRHQDIDLELEQLGVGDRGAAGKIAYATVLLPVREQGGNVEAGPRVDTASHVRNCADREPRFMHELRGPAADVAEALYGDGCL